VPDNTASNFINKISKMSKVCARRHGSVRIYVHEDLVRGAAYFRDRIEERLEADDLVAINFDYMACLTLLAFSFEARINFIGYKKLTDWDEKRPILGKLKLILKYCSLSPDWNKRPYSSITLVKRFRDLLAHGKPIEHRFDEVVEMSWDDLSLPYQLEHKWRKACTIEQLRSAFADLDRIWAELCEAARIKKLEMRCRGTANFSLLEVLPDNDE